MIDFPRNEGLEFAEWTTSPSTLVQWMQKDLNNTSDRKIKDAKSFQREKAGHLEKIMSPRIPGNPFKCWKNIVFLYRSLYLAKMSIKCGNSIKTFSDLQGLIYLFFLRKQLDDVFHKNDGGEKKSRKIKIMVSMKCVCCVLSRISRVQFCATP